MPEPGPAPPGRSALNALLIPGLILEGLAQTAPRLGGAVAVEAP